eukprot:137224-Pelagomonas_calceolata.AAC.3
MECLLPTVSLHYASSLCAVHGLQGCAASKRQKDTAGAAKLKSLSNLAAYFTARKAELRQKKAELDAQARFLESESINNKEVDARIAFYDREMVGLHRQTGLAPPGCHCMRVEQLSHFAVVIQSVTVAQSWQWHKT